MIVTLIAGCTVSSPSWTTVAFDDLLQFRSPVPLRRVGGQGIDSRVGEWRGQGIEVVIDYSPFADPLTSRTSAPDQRVFEETVDGRRSRIVSTARPDGGRTVAIHFPDLGRPRGGPAKLTMVVEADSTLDEGTLLELVQSITFTEHDTASSDSS